MKKHQSDNAGTTAEPSGHVLRASSGYSWIKGFGADRGIAQRPEPTGSDPGATTAPPTPYAYRYSNGYSAFGRG